MNLVQNYLLIFLAALLAIFAHDGFDGFGSFLKTQQSLAEYVQDIHAPAIQSK